MKIARLDLRAVGPFTDLSLDLSAGRQGLHIVEGPNEAGKSSALRALRQMLFGFGHKTDDDFVHKYDNLRVGATLRDESGRELAFLRRKRKLRTLWSSDDATELPDDALDPFLGGVTEDQFRKLFGIDHDELLRGSQATQDSGGEIGELLFGVGRDLAGLRAYQKKLEEQAGKIFLAKGRTQTIHAAIQAYAAAQKEIESTSMRSSEWIEATEALDAARKERVELDALRAANSERRSRLERHERAIPDIAVRRRVLEELAELATVPLLRDDFSRERIEAEREMSRSTHALADAEESIARIDDTLATLVVPNELLAAAARIDDLQKRSGSQAKGARDASGLERDARQHRETADRILDEMGLKEDATGLDAIRPKPAWKTRMIALVQAGSALDVEKREAATALARARKTVAELKADLESQPPAGDPEPLQFALTRARRLGDLRAAMAKADVLLAEQIRRADDDRRRLPLKVESLEAIEALALPPQETIERFERAEAEARRAVEGAEASLAALARRERDLLERIERQQRDGRVPTEADLSQSRAVRDAAWHDLKPGAFEGSTLPAGELIRRLDAFEASVRRADAVADALRQEAARVADRESWGKDLEAIRAEMNREAPSLDATRRALDAQAASWNALWAPILRVPPLPPREMREWHTLHAGLVEQIRGIRTQRAVIASLRSQSDDACRDLTAAAKELDRTRLDREWRLDELMEDCQTLADRVEAVASIRSDLEIKLRKGLQAIAEAEAASAEAVRAHDAWRARWAEAVARLGLDASATIGEATTAQARFEELFHALDKARDLQARLDAIGRERQEFDSDARALWGAIAPDLLSVESLDAVDQAVARLGAARETKTRRDQLSQDRERFVETASRERRIAAEQRDRLAALCREAGCSVVDELPRREEQSARRSLVESRRREADDRLLRLAGHQPLEQFIREAGSLDLDALPSSKLREDEEAEALDARRQLLGEQIGSLQEGLRRMDEQSAEARSIDAAARKQHAIAIIGAGVEEFSRLKIASALLRRSMERYRLGHQAPLLAGASAHFRDLTGGSFSGLRASFDDDKPRLVGLRAPDGAETPVEAMSTGTVDQLYLALKLATLEHHLDRNPPMPFIVDDVLIQFDDDRSLAALRAFAKLSARTQVLFFTHHRHLVELAREHLDSDVLFVHELRRHAAVPA